jgi:hypothetical protein
LKQQDHDIHDPHKPQPHHTRRIAAGAPGGILSSRCGSDTIFIPGEIFKKYSIILHDM